MLRFLLLPALDLVMQIFSSVSLWQAVRMHGCSAAAVQLGQGPKGRVSASEQVPRAGGAALAEACLHCFWKSFPQGHQLQHL